MAETSTSSPAANYAAPQKGLSPIFIIGALFFVFGFITWVNSVLIPYLEIACELTPSQAVLVTFASYIAYAVMAFPSSWILSKTGFKRGMIFGLIVMAAGALIFIPAATSRTYGLFLTGLFIMGTGMALLQTASNPYITILGPIESAAKRISVMGVCNKTAGAIAPLIMGTLLLDGMDRFKNLTGLAAAEKEALLNELASKIIYPYIVIAIGFIILAVVIRYSSLPDIKNEDDIADGDEQPAVTRSRASIFSYPYLWLGFVTIFLYVGVEVIAGDMTPLYAHSYFNIPLDDAKHYTTYTMLGMLGGYLLGIILIPKVIKQETALKISAILGVVLSLGVIYSPGHSSVLLLSLLGFANAQMWPAIWPLSIHGLGRFLKTGSALLIVGIAGGAIMPKVWAIIAETTGMQQAFWLLVPCYLFILYFATWGHKVGTGQK